MSCNVQVCAIHLRNDSKPIGGTGSQTRHQARVMVGTLHVLRTPCVVSTVGHDEAAGFSRCCEIEHTIIHMNALCSYVHQTPDGLRRSKLQMRNVQQKVNEELID